MHFNWVNFMCVISQIKIKTKKLLKKPNRRILQMEARNYGNDKVPDLKVKNTI